MLNLDRNVCNILVQHEQSFDEDFDSAAGEKETWSLVPIDHGLSIPDTLAVSSYELAWLSFDQAE